MTSQGAIRALDNVLEATLWREEQREAQAKRASASVSPASATTLICSTCATTARPHGRCERYLRRMRDAAYEASAELAEEKVRSRCSKPTVSRRAALRNRVCRRNQDAYSQERCAQLASAVDRADTNHLARVRGQRLGRIEPTFSWT